MGLEVAQVLFFFNFSDVDPHILFFSVCVSDVGGGPFLPGH